MPPYAAAADMMIAAITPQYCAVLMPPLPLMAAAFAAAMRRQMPPCARAMLDAAADIAPLLDYPPHTLDAAA